MSTHAEKIRQLADSLADLLEKGISEVLMTDETYDANDADLYDAPRIRTEGRHGDVLEFVVLSIQDGGNLTCGGLGEIYGDIEIFTIRELTTDELVQLSESLTLNGNTDYEI